MKSLLAARLLLMFLFCTCLLPGIDAQAQTTSANDRQVDMGYRYVGTWNATWTSDDNDLSFGFYMQLGLDGNVITTENDEFAVSQGVWTGLSKDSANLTLYQYSFSALQSPYQGTFKVRAKVSASKDGEQISGRYYLEFFDPNNVLQFTDMGKIEGRRVHVEPMPQL